MTHPYIRFRISLARHAVAQLAARLRSSVEIAAIVLGPTIVGLLAFAALPAMLAAAQPLPYAIPLLLLHGMAMSLPFALLRPQVVPAGVRAWLLPLPIPARLERLASAAVAGMLAAPLALAYGASLLVWLGQRPAWLLPARAVAGTLLSLFVSWACGAWMLAQAGAAPRPVHKTQAAVATYAPQPRAGHYYLWRQLFWLPLWRGGNPAGVRLAVLLAAAGGAFAAWMSGPAFLPRVAGAIMASILLVLLAHDADTALRTQAARVRGVAGAWPVDAARLVRHARAVLLLAFVPFLLALAAGAAAAGAWHGRAGRLWLLLACATPALLVLTPPFTARGRMALVACCIMVLCAVGSKA